ncbi:MAG: endonuclease [Duncaniella sp.]|nr:endonuclease [Duncaniella sp.]
MLRKLIASLLLAGIPASGYPDVEMPVSGKKGEGLAQVLRLHCSPLRLPEQTDLSFTFFDHFEGRPVTITAGALPSGYTISGLVSPEWWKESDIYGDTIVRDLANYYPASPDVSRHRASFPPGEVTETRYETPLWCSGIGPFGTIEAEFYTPPASLRGRLARTYFYMALIYPQGLMRPKAYTMFTGQPYPGLTAYATRILLPWHRDNPPSPEEIEINDSMLSLQGNFNPFVSNPEFVEYLWGDKAGEIYEVKGTPVPLHSAYSLSDTVWLTTPDAPSDALWTIDGRPEKNTSVAASALGRGTHDITFTSALTGLTGRVMITVL